MDGFKYELSEADDQWLDELPDPKDQWVYSFTAAVIYALKTWFTKPLKYIFTVKARNK